MPAAKRPQPTAEQLLELDILIQDTELRLDRLQRSGVRTQQRLTALHQLRDLLLGGS